MPAKKISDRALLQQLADNKRTVSELADFFDVHPSTISKRCKRLQKKGIAKVAAQQTLERRWTRCGNYKIYSLTDAGKQLLRGGEPHPLAEPPEKPGAGEPAVQMNIEDFRPQFKQPEADVHGIQFKIPITGERGEVPCRLRSQRMKNWTKYHGQLYGAYVCITPSHVIVWPRGRGSCVDDALDDAKEQLQEIWMAFRHELGWEIDNTIMADNKQTGAKYGALYIDTFRALPSPLEGRQAVVDDTPTYGTVHAKGDETVQRSIVDTLIDDARWRRANVDKIVTEDQLGALAEELVNVVEGRVVSGLLEQLQQRSASEGPSAGQRSAVKDEDEETRYHG